jgi:hypothetical protein
MQKLKAFLFFMLLTSLALVSCKNDDDDGDKVCSVNDPITELPWLKKKIDSLNETRNEYSKYQSISHATFRGSSVFAPGNCCPTCLTDATFYWNCAGHRISIPEQEWAEVTDRKIIWRDKDYACSIPID